MPPLENVGLKRLGQGSLSHANQKILAQMPPAELHSFLQAWLFFGLLYTVLGDSFDRNEFITTILDGEEERLVITTTSLLPRLEAWEHEIRQDENLLVHTYEHIAEYLNVAYACLAIRYSIIDNDFKLHLASVAETIGYTASKACKVAWTDRPERSLIPLGWGDTISEDFRKTVLFERGGCCPSQWQMFAQEFKSPHSLRIVADTFREDADRSQHRACDAQQCQARRPSQHGKITRHVDDSCQCAYVYVEEAHLAECLDKGSLPLIRIRHEMGPDTVSVEVIPSTSSSSYVALSHVWADGLGNHDATALPRCQILRLKGLIDRLNLSVTLGGQRIEPEMLLWCDTICCPVVSEDAKRKALSQMRRTYVEASVVLVLESSFTKLRVKNMNLCEASLRVVLSRWMTRLWTLQEGALPARSNRLLFQFEDRAVRIWTLYHHVATVSHKTIQWRAIASDIIRRLHTFTDLFSVEEDSPGRQAGHFRDVMSGLQHRSVTVPSDEPILIATLLALDVGKVLEKPLPDRMNALWRLLGVSPQGIPRDLPFHMGPKLSEPGLRWAPQSLLSGNEHFFFRRPDAHERQGFLASEEDIRGLLVHLAGLRLRSATPARRLPPQLAGFGSLPSDNEGKFNLLMRDDEDVWYLLCNRLSGEPDCPSVLESMSDSISRLSSPWILYHGSNAYGPEVKGYDGLLVDEVHETPSSGQQIPCVKTKSHAKLGRLPMAGSQCCQTICQAAYSLAQTLASSAVAQRFEEYKEANLNDPDWVSAAREFDDEMDRLSKSTFAIEALAASGNSPDERGTSCMNAYIERFYRGIYLDVVESAPGDCRWFLD